MAVAQLSDMHGVLAHCLAERHQRQDGNGTSR